MMNGLWVILPGFCAGNYHIFPARLLGNFDGFSADSDGVMDRLLDGLTDESDDVQTERNFPGFWSFGKFHTAILVGILTMNLADGWMDGTDDRHTDRQMEFQVESHLC